MKKSIKLAWSAAIFIVSAVGMLALGGFNPQAFLIDDNRNQWFPVIEKAYEQFFGCGILPSYNFYLLKGLPIAEPGYYATLNPVMLISYVLSNYTPLPFSTITLYISILFGLGNVAMFAACRKLGCNIRTSLMLVLAYSACSTFVSLNYWYYVFNNYFFIPLLIYAVLKSEGTKSAYFACGIVLAFEILMGNVQYTCYHYMVYCIVCVPLVVSRPKYIKTMLSNIGTGLVLSLPCLILLISASSGGFENSGEFLANPAELNAMFFNSVIPDGILYKNGISLPLPNSSIMGRSDSMLFYTAPLSVPIMIYLAHEISAFLKNDKIRRINSISSIKDVLLGSYRNYKNKPLAAVLPTGVILACLFFILFAANTFVSYILSCIPIIRNFRYLFKAFFVAVPLMAVVMAFFSAKKSSRIKKIASVVCIIFTLIGLVNNFFVISSTRNMFNSSHDMTYTEEAEYTKSVIAEKQLDLKNYRSLTIFQNSHSSMGNRDYTYNITRNFPAYTESFSLLAYEVSADKARLEKLDMIINPYHYYPTLSNAASMLYFYKNLAEKTEETIHQLSENSIKYLILENATEHNQSSFTAEEKFDYTPKIADIINNSNALSVVRVEDFGNGYTLLELDGVDSLCTSKENKPITLSDERMDLLSFIPVGSDSYKLSFSFDKNIIAYQLDGNGNEILLETQENDAGNITVSGINDKNGTVFLGYRNPVNILAFISEIVITAAFTAVLIYFLLKKETAEKQRNIS